MKKERIPNSEPLKYFSRYNKKTNESKKNKNLLVENPKMTVESNKKYHLYREMAYMADKFWPDVFDWIEENETVFIKSQKFLKRHYLRKETRTKMVDWMVEVFYLTKSDPYTFELAVHIMDRYIQMTKKILYDKDIHLIGLTCIYIASKMMDDEPIKLINISKNIGKSEFLNIDIIEKEKEISSSIEYEFLYNGIYDVLMALFFDLNVTYYKIIDEIKGKEIIGKYMDFCVILSKLILYNESLLSYKTSLISVVIINFGFDILNLNEKKLSKDIRYFLTEWIRYIINEMNIITYDMNNVYNEILNLYKIYIYQPIQENNNIKFGIKEKRKVEQINLLKLYKDKLI